MVWSRIRGQYILLKEIQKIPINDSVLKMEQFNSTKLFGKEFQKIKIFITF